MTTQPLDSQLLDPGAYGRLLALRDLTDAALGPHAMQLLVQHALDALLAAWNCPVVVYRAPPLVPAADNYDDLGYPPDGASRDARYTRYLTPELLLRTQTSAMIPRALRMIAPARYADVLLACPGLTYRRDAIDRLHVGEPHQLDLWRIVQRPLTRDDLVAMIEAVAGAMLPGVPLRLEPAVHPYTLDGLEVYGNVQGRWVEILECGRAHPELLADAGLASASGLASGLAMGIGLDRMLMLRKGIEDIRALRSTDPRIQAQMLDLEPYRAVSSQPPIYRDLSVAVAEEANVEELGDRVRSTLAAASGSIESVEVLSETSYLELSLAARRRLGISPRQKNVLLRLVIRDLERTLTSAEANELRDAVYAVLHEGSVRTWASKEMQL
jgi:phenylalanyl-tRNA synthetase alpha chain